MADAHVNGMGYANGKSYGISISSGPINVLKATLNTVPRPKGIIVDFDLHGHVLRILFV